MKHEKLLFLRQFLRSPHKVASVLPTSRTAARTIAAKIRTKSGLVIVECGPGTGAVTEEILKRLPSDGSLILIERSEEFVRHLRKKFTDKRLRVFHDSAEHIAAVLRAAGKAKADYVVSGIPFSFLPAEAQRQIAEAARDVLSEEGSFIVYNVQRKMRGVLGRAFPSVAVSIELRNVPPLFVFEAKKKDYRSS